MQKIKLTNGYYKYKTIPLYLGVKVIDKEKSLDNLLLLKQILNEENIFFLLAFGTLLGIIRDKDFISHDEDIDLIIWDEYKQQFFDTLPTLKKYGFDVARYDRRGLISIIRNGEYIDIYIFKSSEGGLDVSGAIFFPSNLIRLTVDYEFKGNMFKIPKYYEKFLEYEYGDNWRIPIKWNNFELPVWKKWFYFFKESVKDFLPDSIYFFLTKFSDKKITNRYQKLYNNYMRKFKND